MCPYSPNTHRFAQNVPVGSDGPHPLLPLRTVSGRARLGREQKEAWPFYRTISGVRLCWEREEPEGPKGSHLCRLRIFGYLGLDPPKRGSGLVGNKLISVQTPSLGIDADLPRIRPPVKATFTKGHIAASPNAVTCPNDSVADENPSASPITTSF